MAAADLDGDGDVDLTSVDIRGKNPSKASLSWFQNDGRGTFERHVIHADEPAWFERHAIGDINGDGAPDVAVVNNRDGHVLWFANNKQAPTGLWQRYVLTTQCPRAYDVVLADVDGDGDLDAATAGYASNVFKWFENQGNPRGEWAMHTLKENYYAANQVIVTDIDGDQRPDVVATADDGSSRVVGANELRWWRNEGRAKR